MAPGAEGAPAPAPPPAPPVHEPLDWPALADVAHGGRSLAFASLAPLVYEQLEARAELAARDTLAAERARLGTGPPAWRYTLSQELRQLLTRDFAEQATLSACDAALAAADEPLGPGFDAATRGRSGATGVTGAHMEHVARHFGDDRQIVGHLLRLPFGSAPLGARGAGGDTGDLAELVVRPTDCQLLLLGAAISLCSVARAVCDRVRCNCHWVNLRAGIGHWGNCA
jgi:hypothetical protein